MLQNEHTAVMAFYYQVLFYRVEVSSGCALQRHIKQIIYCVARYQAVLCPGFCISHFERNFYDGLIKSKTINALCICGMDHFSNDDVKPGACSVLSRAYYNVISSIEWVRSFRKHRFVPLQGDAEMSTEEGGQSTGGLGQSSFDDPHSHSTELLWGNETFRATSIITSGLHRLQLGGLVQLLWLTYFRAPAWDVEAF